MILEFRQKNGAISTGRDPGAYGAMAFRAGCAHKMAAPRANVIKVFAEHEKAFTPF